MLVLCLKLLNIDLSIIDVIYVSTVFQIIKYMAVASLPVPGLGNFDLEYR